MGGAGQLKTGSSGKDLILDVPCGTEIYNEDMTIKLHEILDDDQTYHFLRGGQGGKGNAHFKSSTNRAPRKFQQGEKGQEATVRLKLKILADVGLVGMPNAGKSSILNFVTNAKSKVADYAFTTLHPHIGMVQKEDLEFVLADIPGLIENASDGKGLGHDFLSHVERCKILIHVIDTTEADPFKNYQIIRQELENYGAEIESKKEIIALNKVELLDEKEIEEIKEKFSSLDRRIFTISAATGYHLDQLTNLCLEYLQDE